MPRIDRWLGETDRLGSWRNEDQADTREGDVGRQIADDPVNIVLVRAGVDQAAQTVRLLVNLPGGSRSSSTGGEAGVDTVTVLGDADLDIRFGDRFISDGQLFEIEYVSPGQPGRVEARARTVQ